MSTRSTVHFHQKEWGSDAPQAIVFKHMDGYPEGEHGMLAFIDGFFAAVEEQTDDTRFGDSTALASKFVVYCAQHYAHDPEKPLDFLSVRVELEDSADIEYRYHIWCGGGYFNTPRPTVTHEAA